MHTGNGAGAGIPVEATVIGDVIEVGGEGWRWDEEKCE